MENELTPTSGIAGIMAINIRHHQYDMEATKVKILSAISILPLLLLGSDMSLARGGSHSCGPHYGGSHHTASHGGHYAGGHGSSHRGGHYKNPGTGDHNGHHP
jgi:hypothetical protein